MIRGLNHLTLAVRDLDASLRFYTGVLGLAPAARWSRGAYLRAGDLWLALALDPDARSGPLEEETHAAFDVAERDFNALAERIREAGAPAWRDNRSEGASVYFLDPDGHKLEIHVGTLATRMKALAAEPPAGLTISGEANGLDGPSVASRHQSFPDRPLRRRDLAADPLVQVQGWLDEAARLGGGDPFAMTLATARSDGLPAARIVALKRIDRRGFVFTSHYDSPKGRQLAANPRAAVVLYWPELGRQVRATGDVERLSEEESQRLFEERPRPARLALLAYQQGEPIPDRAALEQRFRELVREHGGREVPRPDWGGYVVRPREVELWQGSSQRLHDRFLYRREGGGAWTLERLAP